MNLRGNYRTPRPQPRALRKGRVPRARARDLLPRARGAPQAPQLSAERPIRRSRSPRSPRSWLHPPLCKCAAARAGPRGGGAGGREGERKAAPRCQCPDGSWRVWAIEAASCGGPPASFPGFSLPTALLPGLPQCPGQSASRSALPPVAESQLGKFNLELLFFSMQNP